MKTEDIEMIEALRKFVIETVKEENAAPEKLSAMVEAAKLVIECTSWY